MAQSKSHETFDRPDDTVMGSDRGFGIVFGCFFAVIAAVNLWGGASPWTFAWLALSAAMFVIAFTQPGILRPLNIGLVQVRPVTA